MRRVLLRLESFVGGRASSAKLSTASDHVNGPVHRDRGHAVPRREHVLHSSPGLGGWVVLLNLGIDRWELAADRRSESTRLNSSHANISYAVFCLKKKKLKPITLHPSILLS